MRIAFATAHRHLIGGVERYVEGAMAALSRRGHTVALVCERRETPDAPLMQVDTDAVWCAADGIDDLERNLARWNPDIVFAHGFASNDVERMVLGRWPAVLFAHGYYGTCATGTKRQARPHLHACTRRFGPACLWQHYPRRCGGLNPRVALAGYLTQRARHHALTRYRAVLVGSQHMLAEYRRHGVREEHLHLAPLFPTGVDRNPSPPPPRPFTGQVVVVGRLTELKGVDRSIRAIPLASQRLKRPLALTVLGDGPARQELETLASSIGVAAVFRGWVDAATRTDAMRHADLLLVPSVWPEPFGLVGIEAACVGLPTAAYAMGGITDWLRPGESGELAPADPPTVDGLSDAIVRALRDLDTHAALRLGAWRIAARFTVDQHLAVLEPTLERACR